MLTRTTVRVRPRNPDRQMPQLSSYYTSFSGWSGWSG